MGASNHSCMALLVAAKRVSLSMPLSRILSISEFIWSQEEQRNMGAWTFVSPRFENILGIKVNTLVYYLERNVLGYSQFICFCFTSSSMWVAKSWLCPQWVLESYTHRK